MSLETIGENQDSDITLINATFKCCWGHHIMGEHFLFITADICIPQSQHYSIDWFYFRRKIKDLLMITLFQLFILRWPCWAAAKCPEGHWSEVVNGCFDTPHSARAVFQLTKGRTDPCLRSEGSSTYGGNYYSYLECTYLSIWFVARLYVGRAISRI